jgi:hypothetical protein
VASLANPLPAGGGLNYSTFLSAIVSIGFAMPKYFATQPKASIN